MNILMRIFTSIVTMRNTPICTPMGFPIPTAMSTRIRNPSSTVWPGPSAIWKRSSEEGYDCSDVLVQLAAVRSALDNTGKVILKDHMRHCMVDAVAAGDEEAIDALCQAIDKFMK